ncbi:protoporphyrinogen oxidase [Neorhodopirellula pilleata]|uniref:Coproporphyrinogen III oxidase n=1 Tax=Neorhodopirellula pilleata TaxID=2714738 RepID=A0A5C6A5F0_9BACT|nr:protoporphyrinogen oxidase [Neorhodopirellula pilleata]TWT93563.1 Protoporphyrinogen oxidase [Neorhodopirellula pilleata]
MKPLRIAIIGGGLSGLATGTHLRLRAAELAEQSRNTPESPREVELSLFESSERVGGVIHTERISTPAGEFTVDHGADMFATNPPFALDLCQRLGVADDLLFPKPDGRGAMIARGDGLIPIPEGFVLMRPTKVWSMMTTPLLSVAGKTRLLAERFVPRRATDLTDEGVGSFVRRRLGQECLDNIVAPLVAGIYTADVERLSMAATMKPIWDMESSDGSLARATLRRIKSGEDSTEQGSSGARYENFRAFPGGMIEFIKLLAGQIGSSHIHLNCPIESISKTDQGIRVQGDRVSEGDELFDHVVLSTPASVSCRLLQSMQSSVSADVSSAIDQVVAGLSAIPYASTAIVVMAVPRNCIARMPKTFGFVVPPKEQRSVLAGSFASEKFPQRAPDDHVIIRAFVGGVLNPQILENSDDEIVRIVARELGDLIGLQSPDRVIDEAAFVRVVRWNRAMPQYEIGHLEKTNAIESAMAKIPGIELRTNAIGGVGIAPVIGAARRMAEKLLA